ncbi:MAG: phospholipase D-like domain-containing protein [Myxococcota bacterium]
MSKAWKRLDGLPVVSCRSSLHLPDRTYVDWLLRVVEDATVSLRALVFIVAPDRDPEGKVREVLEAIADAVWRGLDVRVMVGTGRPGSSIERSNRIAVLYMKRLGIPVKMIKPLFTHSVHSKAVIADSDTVILGSHNWTHNALAHSTEDSIACLSSPLADVFSHQFDRLWFDAEVVDAYEGR